jgi:hypothetical protein
MEDTPPPPIRPEITDQIRGMKPGDYRKLYGAKPPAVWKAVQRVKEETNGIYVTQKTDDGSAVQVWRIREETR